MGLAELVFPGSTHSRFAHSLGTMHVASRIIDSINRKSKNIIDLKTKKKLRLAALLHDIGHLPLSHAMEIPVQRLIYEEKSVSDIVEINSGSLNSSFFGPLDRMARPDLHDQFTHERFGSYLLENRTDLQVGLGNLNTDNQIGKYITREDPAVTRFGQLISSSLDADRLDFLLRDSASAGVAYGKIDLDYIIENIGFDESENTVYVDSKGITALQHFLTARYHLYNITFHKTVTGLELLAKAAYYEMCKCKSNVLTLSIPRNLKEIENKARNDDNFIRFNDEFFWEAITGWRSKKQYHKTLRESLLNRRPPITLYEEMQLVDQGATPEYSFKVLKMGKYTLHSHPKFNQLIKDKKYKRENLALFEQKIKHEETGPKSDYSETVDEETESKLCKVLKNGKITPLIELKGSIIHELSQKTLYIRRLYYLPVNDSARPDKRSVEGFRQRMTKLFE